MRLVFAGFAHSSRYRRGGVQPIEEWAAGDVRDLPDEDAVYLLETFPEAFSLAGEPPSGDAPPSGSRSADGAIAVIVELASRTAKDLIPRIASGELDELLSGLLAQDGRKTVRAAILERRPDLSPAE